VDEHISHQDQIIIREFTLYSISMSQVIRSALDMPDVPKGQLPPHLELQRTRVVCRPDAASYVCICF
jgi:hypothetical protein